MNHTLFITEIKTEIKGITGVNSYQEDEILLTLHSSNLLLSGRNLHIENLNVQEGTATVTGEVLGVKYKKRGEKAGFIKRLSK